MVLGPLCLGCRVIWPQHYDIHTDIHTDRQTYIHTDRQTEPKYDIEDSRRNFTFCQLEVKCVGIRYQNFLLEFCIYHSNGNFLGRTSNLQVV